MQLLRRWLAPRTQSLVLQSSLYAWRHAKDCIKLEPLMIISSQLPKNCHPKKITDEFQGSCLILHQVYRQFIENYRKGFKSRFLRAIVPRDRTPYTTLLLATCQHSLPCILQLNSESCWIYINIQTHMTLLYS